MSGLSRRTTENSSAVADGVSYSLLQMSFRCREISSADIGTNAPYRLFHTKGLPFQQHIEFYFPIGRLVNQDFTLGDLAIHRSAFIPFHVDTTSVLVESCLKIRSTLI